MNPLPPQHDLSRLFDLADYERMARSILSEPVWAYLNGGAGDELTVAENLRAWDRLRLMPRVLADLGGTDASVSLLGQRFGMPVLVAPTARHALFHPDAESATALGAAAMGAGMVAASLSTEPLERIADHYGEGLWLQMDLERDHTAAADSCARAEAAGCAALVLTADAPVHCFRYRERRAGFRFPDGDGVSSPAAQAAEDRIFGSAMLGRAPGWSDLEWLCGATRLPVWLKGVMHPADAGLALRHGASGIIVSNHGGRVLDGVPATLEALPDVVREVAGRAPVLVDGGIRRGTDVVKALALGASAVLLGRPILHGLAVGGAAGVAHCLKILRTELEAAMALTGCPTADSIRQTPPVSAI
ncbi:MAG: alpha-hydroxy-acid oxidizing protein [Verrucomicrobia bacterium]|nr:alpha-hydroxy-acid oxidizing protein [Verrucomicrobiota bacterium]